MRRTAFARSMLASGALIASMLVTLPAAPIAAANGAWSGTGPRGGSVNDVAVDPSHHSTVWAAAGDGQVFRSTDRGQTWQSRSKGIPAGRSVTYLAVSNADTIYAATFAFNGDFDTGAAIYRTIDGGAHWKRRSNGFMGAPVLDFVAHPTDPDIAYFASYSGIFKTADGGAHWHQIQNGLPTYAYSLLIRPNMPEVLFAGTTSGVYRTTDGGAHWSPRTTGLDETASSFAIDPFDPTRLYAGTYGDYVYVTENSGGQWDRLTTDGLPNTVVDKVVVDPDQSRLYGLVRDNGVYTLDTATIGASWVPASEGMPSPGRAWSIAVDPVDPDNVYVGLQGPGMARSTDRADSWSPASVGLTATHPRSLAVDPEHPSTVYTATNEGGVFKTEDAGRTWHRRTNGLTYDFVNALAVSPSDPHTLYAVTSSSFGVAKSTDGADSWQATNTDESGWSIVIHPTDPDTVWMGTVSDGVFMTTDGGAQWDPANTGLPSDSDIYPFVTSMVVSPSNPKVLYLGSYREAFKSTDGGGSWAPASTGLEATNYLQSLAIHPTKPRIVYAAVEDQGIYRTTDGGATWTLRGLGGRNTVAVAIDPLHPTTLYAGLQPGGVYRSLDAGHTWMKFSAGMVRKSASVLAVGPIGQRVYAGLYGGGVAAYRYP